VALVMVEVIGDSKGTGMSFSRHCFDVCHRSFHVHHEVELETEIFKLHYLLQECVLLCFIKLLLGNRCGPGVSSSEPRSTHPPLKIVDIPPRPSPLK